jgi:hypothetical protein
MSFAGTARSYEASNIVFLESEMKQAGGHPSAYVAEIRQGDWRVVVPIRGKLSSRGAQFSFRNEKEASTWLHSEIGMDAVSVLRKMVHAAGKSSDA